MKETIIDLWNGNLSPYSDTSVNAEREEELSELIDKQRSEILAKLDNEGKKCFKRFEEHCGELGACEQESAFVKGFSLAVKLLSESLM